MEQLYEIPIKLVCFENHLKKPVRIHNAYKVARDLKITSLDNNSSDQNNQINKEKVNENRVPKARKWKSKNKNKLSIDSNSTLNDIVCHKFAEGPFITLSDLILLPSYFIIVQALGENIIESLLPLTYKWYKNVTKMILEMNPLTVLNSIKIKPVIIESSIMPIADDVSLYKCDPKRHNPKKRLFTKEESVESALNSIIEEIKINVSQNTNLMTIDWNSLPDCVNPATGYLPNDRVRRKSQQLENLVSATRQVAKETDLIVDFCSGSGHLGILIAYLLPKCTVILLENKEQSLLRARERVHKANLKNVSFIQSNLDLFIGKFDVGVALHACGTASDLVLDKCIKVNAKFVICPCCYGSIHIGGEIAYPRSYDLQYLSLEHYLNIRHAADQTHEDHILTARGENCMAIIDMDRLKLATTFGYTVTLSRLTPPSCTPKNNLLVGVPTKK